MESKKSKPNLIEWRSDDEAHPGEYCIDEDAQTISHNGHVVCLVDENDGLVMADVLAPGRLASLCRMYLSEWLYSKQNPTTIEDFQEILTEIQK